MNKPNDDEKLTFKEMLQSVGAAMLGVQSDKARERDFKKMTLKQFIVLGVITTLIFIALVAGVVTVILSSLEV